MNNKTQKINFHFCDNTAYVADDPDAVLSSQIWRTDHITKKELVMDIFTTPDTPQKLSTTTIRFWPLSASYKDDDLAELKDELGHTIGDELAPAKIYETHAAAIAAAVAAFEKFGHNFTNRPNPSSWRISYGDNTGNDEHYASAAYIGGVQIAEILTGYGSYGYADRTHLTVNFDGWMLRQLGFDPNLIKARVVPACSRYGYADSNEARRALERAISGDYVIEHFDFWDYGAGGNVDKDAPANRNIALFCGKEFASINRTAAAVHEIWLYDDAARAVGKGVAANMEQIMGTLQSEYDDVGKAQKAIADAYAKASGRR